MNRTLGDVTRIVMSRVPLRTGTTNRIDLTSTQLFLLSYKLTVFVITKLSFHKTAAPLG